MNQKLFHYFDIFMKYQKHSPSRFQHKIHSCTLSEEDINISLQNKVLNEGYLFDKKISNRLLIIGDEISETVDQIDEIIKRLYSFNLFLPSNVIQILRDIHEKLFRYTPNMVATTVVNGMPLQPVNPSISYMTKVLIELQNDYKKLRQYVFKNQIIERQFVISKMQYFFYQNDFKNCVKVCKRWIKRHPYDSELQLSYLIRSYLCMGKKNLAYKMLETLLDKKPNLVSSRNTFHSLLSDPTALSLIHKRYNQESIDEMNRVVNKEKTIEKALFASNTDLKRYYAEKKVV